MQEQKGLYGAFIIHPAKPTIKADREAIAILSDWSDENADQIIRNLRKDGDYYLYKKGTVRSLWGALRAGALGTYLHNEWTRMGGMDLSDVGYDAFLINGKRDSRLLEARPGEVVRLRVINAGASTYFNVGFGKAPVQVISADGTDVAPLLAKNILMGMAETYDLLIKMPNEPTDIELRATAQDGTGYASAWIGMKNAVTKITAADQPQPDLYAPMNHSEHEGHTAQHDHHVMHSAHSDHGKGLKTVEQLNVDELRSPTETAFPSKTKVHEVKLVLGGDMKRYVWHINGKALYQDRTLTIREGEVVRYTFQNDTMMHHPMHLHGHFFRVLNSNGEFSPLKHTVDVPPHSSRTIEFMANEPGEWMLHCHNLYHMKSGMARVVSYSTYVPSAEVRDHIQHDPHLHDHLYYDGLIEAATQHAKAKLRLSKTWDTFEGKVESREDKNGIWEFEGDLFYRRWFGNYLNLVLGGTSFDDRQRATAGVGYLLPMLIETTLLIDHEGDLRLDVGKHFQWTQYVFSEVEFTFRQHKKTEYEVSLMYAPNWHWSGGLMLTEEKWGVGAQYKF